MTVKSLSINSAARAPKWQVLRKQILEVIARGDLRPGDALPSEMHLIDETGLSRTTVRQALKRIEEEGIIRREKGRGTFISEGYRCQSAEARSADEAVATRLFGLVVQDSRITPFVSMSRGFTELASDSNSQVMVRSTYHSQSALGDIILEFLDAGVSALAITPPINFQMPPHQLSQLKKMGIPIVQIHRQIENLPGVCIKYPMQSVGQRAAAELIRHGHRNLLFVSPLRYVVSEGICAAFQAEVQRQGVSLSEADTLFAQGQDGDAEAIKVRIMQKLANAEERPTAVFCTGDIMAEQIYLWALQAGLRVPQDLSIVAVGDKERVGSALRDKISAVTVDEYRFGRLAGQLLEQALAKKQADCDVYEDIMPDFFAGETLKAL